MSKLNAKSGEHI